MKSIQRLTTYLAAGVLLGAASAGAQTVYSTDFTTDDGQWGYNFAQYGGEDVWSLDTSGSGALNLSAVTNSTDGNLSDPASAAALQLPGWGGNNFVISSTFTLNDRGDDGSFESPLGIGFLSTSSELDRDAGSLYLGEIVVGHTGSNFGRVRLQSFGDSNPDFDFTADWIDDPTTILDDGATLEMRVTGSYDGLGALSMAVDVLDESGTVLASGTGSDPTPLTGEYFGFRNRIVPAAGSVDWDFNDFSVIPEPSTMALLFGGVVFAATLVVRRRRRES